MARWLVTGAAGQLGSDVVNVLTSYGMDVTPADRTVLDVTDAGAVDHVLGRLRPDVVVNCAAYTAVDDAESDEPTATRVNGEAPGHLAQWCAASGVRLVHVSSDYVFDGRADTPYDESEPVAPRSAYGRSKVAGERAALAAGGDVHVVRSSWVYGATGANFVKTMARLAGARDSVTVVDDQHGAPTWSFHLARGLVALGAAAVPAGIWHCSAAGDASWYVFARAVFAELGVDPARVQPTSSDSYPRPAPRPAYSVLSNRKWQAAGLPDLPHWRDALHEAFVAVGAELSGSAY